MAAPTWRRAEVSSQQPQCRRPRATEMSPQVLPAASCARADWAPGPGPETQEHHAHHPSRGPSEPGGPGHAKQPLRVSHNTTEHPAADTEKHQCTSQWVGAPTSTSTGTRGEDPVQCAHLKRPYMYVSLKCKEWECPSCEIRTTLISTVIPRIKHTRGQNSSTAMGETDNVIRKWLLRVVAGRRCSTSYRIIGCTWFSHTALAFCLNFAHEKNKIKNRNTVRLQ